MDPLPDTTSEFLPNELDLPPGVLAELYRRRWSVEKVFDQLKNKLDQQQAWGSSLVPRKPNPSSSCSPTTGGCATKTGWKNSMRNQPSRRPAPGPSHHRSQRDGGPPGNPALDPSCPSPAGHPVQREVPPLAPALPARITHGSHRRAPPQATLGPVIAYQTKHRSDWGLQIANTPPPPPPCIEPLRSEPRR